MQTELSLNFSKSKIIQLGSYYTPKILVEQVYDLINPFLKEHGNNAIILDSAAGNGAFIPKNINYDLRIADCDQEAYMFLLKKYDHRCIFYTNSLINSTRDKFSISDLAYLIIVGNPPYNDITSEFKNGEKGKNICDPDLFDRDLGVSFLKSYNKLKADIVCVLHPLSYLIKETNFKRLKTFKDNYVLKKGIIFSSAMFQGTGGSKFPIVISLYERNPSGMTFEYIRNFKFNILGSVKRFTLLNYNTTDGYINKYPPRKNELKKSPIGIYYYTFRDYNSLKKNASFMFNEHPNGIVVTIENFYKYAYLYSLKRLFNPPDSWLYGNLSPLINTDDLENNKKLYVLYALKTCSIFNNLESIVKQLTLSYGINVQSADLLSLENRIKESFRLLIPE